MAKPCTCDRQPCNIAHERITIESRLIRRFIREAKKDGWTPYYVAHDEQISVTGEYDTIQKVFEVDESVIWFRNPVTRKSSPLQVVLGNGEDCLVDCGTSLEAIYNRVHDLI